MRRAALVCAAVVAAAALFGPAPAADLEAATAERFGLRIPEERREPLEGDRIVLTRDSVSSVVIDILDPFAQQVDRERIFSWVNGEAAATVADLRRTRVGLALILDLALKPHLKLEPGENSIEVVAENERGRRFYRNWVVEVRDRSQHEWFTYEFVNGPGEENPAPPEVEVLSPLVPPVAEAGGGAVRVALQARVVGYHPLALVRIDGAPLDGVAGELETGVERRLTVPANQREVVLRATDARGNETLVRIPVLATRPPPAPRLSGRRYLLSIGITHHEAEDLPDLPAASSDASALADMLSSRGGFPADSILVLRDREATLARVRSALESFLALPGPDDLAIVYFSGYGLHGYGSDADRIYLACADTRVDQLRVTALDLADLRHLLNQIDRVKSRNVLLLFEVRSLDVMDQLLTGTNLVNTRLLRLYSEEKGRTVLVSARAGQKSRTGSAGETGSRGLFAAALLAGLTGEADGNRDRVLTVAELFGYVTASVQAKSRGVQRPSYRIADRGAGIVQLAAR